VRDALKLKIQDLLTKAEAVHVAALNLSNNRDRSLDEELGGRFC
jgi:hypothetical protein